jgi:hypothetical protein
MFMLALQILEVTFRLPRNPLAEATSQTLGRRRPNQ